jgi:tRNA1Val (adenine37-N6)-methyltransferase
MSDIFRFKQFSVNQSGCAMKVNTDGVLLGALATVHQPTTILDIGSGTGVIALMLAQRFGNSHIDAVEIDRAAAETAKSNFNYSPFANRLTLHSSSFEQFFTDHPDKRYDLIVSNPPFYINSLESPGAGKTLAKHADQYFFERLVRGVEDALTEDGLFWLILPPDTAGIVKNLADDCLLRLHNIINIYSYPESTPHREVLVFGTKETPIELNKLVIYNEPKHYTQQYQELLRSFLTIF